MMHSRNKKELTRAIQDQLKFITNSCDLYDRGCAAEAIRIAAAISVLLEKRRNSVGLLLSIQSKSEIKLLSTVPLVEKIETDKLIVSKIKKYDELRTLHSNGVFYLTYIEDLDNWYLQAFDYQNREVSCYINEFSSKLQGLGLINPNMNTLICRWVCEYSELDHSINDIGKHIILTHLYALLGYPNRYASSSYFPMIEKDFIFNHKPKLEGRLKRFLAINEWLKEIIFAIPDQDRKIHILTRKELIDSTRDQDGGGHFDIKLTAINYYHSKYGKILAKYEKEEITTKNFHLIMLRQLGYEIQNSPILDNI